MKKFFSMMAVLAAMFTFVACETPGDEPTDQPEKGGKLATPELTETHTPTSFTVAWDAVSGADAYIVNFKGKNTTVTECSFTVEGLNEGTYTVKVKATGANRTDSDLATIQVTITGLTEVDWFTQTLTVLTEPVEVEGQDGPYTVYPYNALEFSWQGTGVVSISYGMFTAEQVEGKSKSEIKASLTDVSSLVQYVNAEGYAGVVPGLTGSTTYKLYALVTNAEGLEFLAVSEATTAKAELAEATKRWLGTYSAMTEKMVNISADTIAPVDQVTNFDFTVTAIEGTANEVYIDGLSQLGKGNYMTGVVLSEDGVDYLCVNACEIFAEMGEGWYAAWLPFCSTADGQHTFVTGDFYGYVFAMAADGSISFHAGNGELNSGVQFTVEAIDAIGYSESGQLGILSLQDGSKFDTFKYGPISNIAKAEAAASALSAKPAIAGVVPTSLVVAM